MRKSMIEEVWPASVRFVPYVGERFSQGFDGQRLLLLGESHYRTEGVSDAVEVTRPYTKNIFQGMATRVRDSSDGPFFRALDLVLTGDSQHSIAEAAEVWRRIAFINLSQSFAGTKANHRPRSQALRDGGNVLVNDILPVLNPDVVLVLGRTAWRFFSHGEPQPGLEPFIAQQVNRGASKPRYIESREVWSLDYEGGSALMTWVYHPSWNVDTWKDRAGALRHLMALAKQS